MRLRTITGTRFPSKCACGCGQGIPCDPDLKVVVDFDTSRPRLSYIPAHSPDFGTYSPPGARSAPGAKPLPGLDPTSAPVPGPSTDRPAPPTRPRPPSGPKIAPETPHEAEEASPSPEAGRAWASGQLVFNAGSFESARAGFAAYALDGETAEQLRARVNRIILEDLEVKVLALRALHEKLGSPGHGPPRTHSPAPSAEGAPTAARDALPRSNLRDPELQALISRIELVVEGDLLYPRRIAKEAAVREALAARGILSLRAFQESDRKALEALVEALDAIDGVATHPEKHLVVSRPGERVAVSG